MNKKIIITGGAGFIGSNLAKGLNELGYKNLIIVDKISQEKVRNLNSIDFIDYYEIDSFLEKINSHKDAEAIFHYGACSSTTESDGNFMIKSNYELSKEIFEFSNKNKIKLIYASSASVYGASREGFSENKKCEEFLNLYSFSKSLFDNYIRRLIDSKKNKSNVVGLRFFNVYGYQENHKQNMASVIRKFYVESKKNGEIKIFKKSNEIFRDFVFIEDIIKVSIYFLRNDLNGIFNVGTGEPTSFKNFALIFKKNFNSKIRIKEIPFPKILVGRYQYHTQADINKLRASGYKDSFVSVEEGVKKYLDLMIKNEGYFEKDKNYFFK